MPANRIDAAISIALAIGLGFILGRAIFSI